MPKLLNKIIKTLIISDFFLNSGWGLMGPIFAIFIVKNVATGSISEAAKIAGFAALSFWITKSLLQIPIGRYLDKNHGEKDDFWFMVAGTFLLALVPIGFLFSNQAWHIYALQMLHALAASLNFPSWSAIFTRHIDKGKEAFEWGTHSTVSGMGMGLAGGIGGIAVAYFGFSIVFIFVSALSLLCGFLLLIIKNDISPENEKTVRIPVQRV
ncbi:MAG: MFS transporter [bacterium]|nr:MFS transporter [bacterium]